MNAGRRLGVTEPNTKRARPSASSAADVATQPERGMLRATTASAAAKLTDCAQLPNGVLMPWVGYGTYKLGQQARSGVTQAIRAGYRMIDTAYIYAGEKTEAEVGKALAAAFADGSGLKREDIFITTKHWRKYHGYDAALGCLERSLQRLQLDYVDQWMMHWPGPAWSTMNRRNDQLAEHGPWHYAAEGQGKDEIQALRAETWRAMEEALRTGKARSLAVSNFTVAHLEALKRTATIWPPAVNQVEMHPHFPQPELKAYCEREGIVLQAYAALGGQDAGKAKWEAIGGHVLQAEPVLQAAQAHDATPAQALLRWALQRGCSVTPKSVSAARIAENAQCFHFVLTDDQMDAISALASNAEGGAGRLCWRTDPLRMLDFD